jgi:hypothetical protein
MNTFLKRIGQDVRAFVMPLPTELREVPTGDSAQLEIQIRCRFLPLPVRRGEGRGEGSQGTDGSKNEISFQKIVLRANGMRITGAQPADYRGVTGRLPADWQSESVQISTHLHPTHSHLHYYRLWTLDIRLWTFCIRISMTFVFRP